MFQQLLTISHNTFTESIRQPIFTVLVLVGALALVLNPSLAAYSMETGGGDNKMLIDLGLTTISLVSLLLAAFTATGVLSSEVENRTVLTVVSKPVARPLFVIGKFLGVVGAIAVAYYVLAIVFGLTVRHRVMSTASDPFDMPVIVFGTVGALVALALATWGNYFYRWVFTSTFMLTLAVTMTVAALLVAVVDKHWDVQSPLAEFTARNGEMTNVVVGLVLAFEATLILTAVAIAASTRLGQLMTLLICLGVFALGAMSHSLSVYVNDEVGIPVGVGVFDSIGAIADAQITLGLKTVYLITKIGYLIVPNLQYLWVADAINEGYALPPALIGSVSAYALLYTGVVLALAVGLFQTREVG